MLLQYLQQLVAVHYALMLLEHRQNADKIARIRNDYRSYRLIARFLHRLQVKLQKQIALFHLCAVFHMGRTLFSLQLHCFQSDMDQNFQPLHCRHCYRVLCIHHTGYFTVRRGKYLPLFRQDRNTVAQNLI